jgi:hypothetical protein
MNYPDSPRATRRIPTAERPFNGVRLAERVDGAWK